MKECCILARMFGQRCLDCHPVERARSRVLKMDPETGATVLVPAPPKPKNLCAKSRPKDKPYEVWATPDGRWTWNVLKKWQIDDDKPYARWFCNVVSPFCPNGELGDVYVADVKRGARRVS